MHKDTTNKKKVHLILVITQNFCCNLFFLFYINIRIVKTILQKLFFLITCISTLFYLVLFFLFLLKITACMFSK